MKCRSTCSGYFWNMAGSLTIIEIALATQETVVNRISTMVFHHCIEAQVNDLLREWVRTTDRAIIYGFGCQAFGLRRFTVLSKIP